MFTNKSIPEQSGKSIQTKCMTERDTIYVYYYFCCCCSVTVDVAVVVVAWQSIDLNLS